MDMYSSALWLDLYLFIFKADNKDIKDGAGRICAKRLRGMIMSLFNKEVWESKFGTEDNLFFPEVPFLDVIMKYIAHKIKTIGHMGIDPKFFRNEMNTWYSDVIMYCATNFGCLPERSADAVYMCIKTNVDNEYYKVWIKSIHDGFNAVTLETLAEFVFGEGRDDFGLMCGVDRVNPQMFLHMTDFDCRNDLKFMKWLCLMKHNAVKSSNNAMYIVEVTLPAPGSGTGIFSANTLSPMENHRIWRHFPLIHEHGWMTVYHASNGWIFMKSDDEPFVDSSGALKKLYKEYMDTMNCKHEIEPVEGEDILSPRDGTRIPVTPLSPTA